MPLKPLCIFLCFTFITSPFPSIDNYSLLLILLLLWHCSNSVFLFVCLLVLFFKTGSLCVTALAVLELAL